MKLELKNLNWDRILFFICLALVLFVLFRGCDKDEPIDYSGYIKEFNELQEVVDSSIVIINRLDSEFDSINNRLKDKYEEIDTANANELRELFSKYFSSRN